MPKESLSVYLAAIDGMSPVLVSITDKTKALDKESQELQQTYEALNKANKTLIDRKIELKKQLQGVNAEVREADKAFKALESDENRESLSRAQEKQQKLRSEITATTKALQENQKIYKENIETARKNALGGESGGSDLSAVWGGLGIGQQLSALAEQASTSLLQSVLGDSAGNVASGELFNAITGASLGTAIAPGIGTAIGAVAGGVLGAASSAMEELGNKDNAFKDYYGGLYEDVKGRSGEMVSSGSTLASGRETNLISFKTLFKDEQAAQDYLDELTDMANRTPFLYDDLVGMSKTLATYGYDKDSILPLLQTVGDAGAALGMSTSDMDSVAQALGRMKSSDKATLDNLNILNDRGIGAVGMLADAKSVSQGDMYSMISKGQISGAEAVEIITAALKEAYSADEETGRLGAMEEQSKTFAGLSSTLEGLQQNLEAQGGEGYNTLRSEGKQEEINSLNGELGEAIGEINAIMGENQARRENLQDQYMREVLDAVLNGKQGSLWSTFNEEQQDTLTQMSQDYASLMEQYRNGDTDAGAELGKLYEVAQILGQAYFEDSDEVARLNQIELDEISAIRDNTAGLTEATQAAYKLSQELSKGMAVKIIKDNYGATIAEGKGGDVTQSTPASSYLGGSAPKQQDVTYGYNGIPHPHAFGLGRVPYDEYPALLHEGERVLTASEARAQDAAGSGGVPIQITINGNFSGTTEEMADQLVEILVRKLEQAAIAAAPK